MVKKKSTSKTRVVYRNAPKKKRASTGAKTGYKYIPSAMATVGLVAVNAPKLKKFANEITNGGQYLTPSKITQRFFNDHGTKKAVSELISFDALATDALAIAGGYVAGEVIKSYAPGVIKRPVGKLAKKIPKVI